MLNGKCNLLCFVISFVSDRLLIYMMCWQWSICRISILYDIWCLEVTNCKYDCVCACARVSKSARSIQVQGVKTRWLGYEFSRIFHLRWFWTVASSSATLVRLNGLHLNTVLVHPSYAQRTCPFLFQSYGYLRRRRHLLLIVCHSPFILVRPRIHLFHTCLKEIYYLIN